MVSYNTHVKVALCVPNTTGIHCNIVQCKTGIKGELNAKTNLFLFESIVDQHFQVKLHWEIKCKIKEKSLEEVLFHGCY